MKDTGTGISQEDIANIFNQFEQGSTQAHLRQEGTGLGLSIVQSLIDRQKGNIQVKSTPGLGSEFTVNLPYTIAKDTAAINDHTRNSNIAPTTKGAIWVIDDDPLILELCGYILKKYQLQYRCFSEPQKMLQAAKKSSPEVVLMDIRMPGMTGFELLQQLKPLLNKETKIYALTAHALPDDREDILRPGFNDLLMKPFMERDLLLLLGAEANEAVTAEHVETDAFNELRKMTGGDEALLQQILKQFIEETKKDNLALQHFIEKDDLLNVAEQLHKLAGRCGQVGFKQIGKELRTAEIKIRNGDIQSMHSQLQYLHRHVEEIIKEAKRHVEV